MTRNSLLPVVTNYQRTGDVMVIAKALIWAVFYDDLGRIDPAITQYQNEPFGHHGPGAVADSSKGAGKWDYLSEHYTCELFKNHEQLPTRSAADVTDLPPSVATFVPKDPTKRRIICMEPKELQFGQQGAARVLTDVLKKSPFTRRAIRLNDQSRNFNLSRDYNFSTIDLSDASDLVSIQLCRLLLPKEVFSFLTRYRSSAIILPDGTLLTRYKAMATMGNALCFPI
jgi:hypothetical protein